MRLLPFAVHGTCMRTTIALRKLLIVSVYLAFPLLACCLGKRESIFLLVVGFSYYVLISLATNRLSAWVGSRRLTSGGLAVVLFCAFVLVPGLALPGRAMSSFLVVGFELALSSYSYCVETSRGGSVEVPLRECLFFLFVNPTVFYPARGALQTEDVGVSGLRRAAAGGI